MELTRKLLLAAALPAALLLSAWTYYELQATQADVEAVSQQVAAPVEKQIIELPEDGSWYWATVFLSKEWRTNSQERELVAWWASNQRLVSLKAQTRFKFFTDNDPMYKLRFSRSVTSLPCVMIQDGVTGRAVYKASGANLPKSANALADDIQECFPRPNPCPRPTPDVKPDPKPDPAPVIPDVKPAPQDDDVAFWIVLALVVVVCGVGTVVVYFRQEAAKQ